MLKALKVARREYLATVRTKGFIIGLVLAPVLMGGSILVMLLTRGRVDTADRRIAVVDRSGGVAATLAQWAERRNQQVARGPDGRRRGPSYFIEIVRPDDRDPMGQRLELSERVRREELRAFLEIGPGVLHPRADTAAAHVAYHSQNSALDETREWIGGQLSTLLPRLRLLEAGIDTSRVPDLFDGSAAEPRGLFSRDAATGRITDAPRRSEAEAIFPSMAVMFMMFIMVIMGAVPQLNATMEEKSQRIAEVVLGSVRPFDFMLGKVLGAVAISLTASGVYVLLGMYSLTTLGLAGVMPFRVVAWFFPFMVLAVAMFGALFAALGAACNDSAEAQSVSFIGMIPMIIPSFMMMPVILAPNATFAVVVSLFPPFTPIMMLMRLATPGGVPAWQPWVGLLGVVLTTAAVVWAGGRLFRVAIMMQGTPPKLQNLVRWALRG